MTSKKPDFRNKLNLVLSIFYKNDGAVAMQNLYTQDNTGLTLAELYSSYDTLIADGHIQHIYPVKGWTELKVASITGQGRIFFEQGGYRDQRNRVDKTIDWFKNNTFFSWVIIATIILTSTWGVVEIAIKIIQLFK
ncbi:MAG: hypothetical protein V4643_00110 [Bacteroidota bacterium]